PAPRDWFLADQIARGRLRLEWAPAQVIVDRPAKVSGDKVEPGGERLSQTPLRLIDEAKREVVLISPRPPREIACGRTRVATPNSTSAPRR
ncbi:hypothetical protein J8J07_21590, partial [Mycobacterium tuberculosis]|nr:hypothetical protein [Mycobacterium tuberculosis]